MLEINIPKSEQWDSINKEYVYTKECTLQMEHSLVSLSKWESKWQIPFLTEEDKTIEQTIDYIKCMTINKNVDDAVFRLITTEHISIINNYISAPMTATWFNEQRKSRPNKEQITAELIYYWMIAYQIPFECQKWHLNRLLTLIRVCDIKNQPQKKMGRKEILNNNAALNAARRKKLGTKG